LLITEQHYIYFNFCVVITVSTISVLLYTQDSGSGKHSCSDVIWAVGVRFSWRIL